MNNTNETNETQVAREKAKGWSTRNAQLIADSDRATASEPDCLDDYARYAGSDHHETHCDDNGEWGHYTMCLNCGEVLLADGQHGPVEPHLVGDCA